MPVERILLTAPAFPAPFESARVRALTLQLIEIARSEHRLRMLANHDIDYCCQQCAPR
jgi:hypothetical protein